MKFVYVLVLLSCIALATSMPKKKGKGKGKGSDSRSKSDSRSNSRSESKSSSRSSSSGSSYEEPAPVDGGDSGEEGNDEPYPYITIHEGLILEPTDGPKKLISLNYPDQAPGDLRQSWSIRSYSPDYPTNLKITCEEFDLPQSEPCEHFELMIDDGDDRQNFCGVKENFSYTTKSDGAGILLATGPEGGGKINCIAEAVKAE